MNNRKAGEVSEINKLIAQFLDDVAKDFSEYSNIKPQWAPIICSNSIDFSAKSMKGAENYSYNAGNQTKESREPLLDVIESNGTVSVILEMRGVDKKELRLTSSGDKLRIATRVLERSIKLPSYVDPKSATASLRSGVLEVTFIRASRPGSRSEIRFID